MNVRTRTGSLPIRLLSPPTFFLVSLNYFLPHFSHNLSQYYLQLEQQHLPPAVGDARQSVLNAWREARSKSSDTLHDATQRAESGIKSGLQHVEDSTGLKVGNALGDAKQKAAEVKNKLV